MSEATKSKGPEAPGQRMILAAPAGGGRLDQVLVDLVPGQSRSRIQQWVRTGRVAVAGVVVTRPGMRLDGGELLQIDVPPAAPSRLEAEAIPLDILYEDRDLIVINKPAGMVVHPAPGHASQTLVNAVLAHAPDLAPLGGEIRPGIVHRLDRDTSGLIVVAKNEPALRSLQEQFARRTVHKAYVALVEGRPPAREGRIEAPIGRDVRHRQRMAVVSETRGRAAVTRYRVLESFARHSLLELNPETGRTHQIRVHLSWLECPIVGDRVYGRRTPSLDVPRQMLHAARLSFRLPGTEDATRDFEAPLPEDLMQALEDARGRVAE